MSNKNMITINSNESYLGKDIREWCEKNCPEIKDQYYSQNTKYRPNDDVYYFVNFISLRYPDGNLRVTQRTGFRLDRDLERSPRRIKPTTEYYLTSVFVDSGRIILEVDAKNEKENFKLLINTLDNNSIYYYDGHCPRNKGKFESQLFKYLKSKYPEHF